MPAVKTILFILLGISAATFIAVWFSDLRRRTSGWPNWHLILVGFVTNFFDTLGVGSFATTTTVYRLRKWVPDELIPGTLNVGHCIPTITQAFIFIAIIEVEMQTLVLTILAAVLGAWLGAGFVMRWPRRQIRIGMGLALLAAAGLILARLAKQMPEGGEAYGLTGTYLMIALAGNFIFGALMMIGVGAYAPIMIMVSLLGMRQKTAFPIMMGACAFLMPTAGMRIIRGGKYDAGAACGLTLGGIPGVILAALLVDSFSLDAMRWLVVVVVTYTALSMLWTGIRETSTDPAVSQSA